MKTLKTLSVDWCCKFRCEGEVFYSTTRIGYLSGRDRNEGRVYINWTPCVEGIPDDDIIVKQVPICKDGHKELAFSSVDRCCFELLKWMSENICTDVEHGFEGVPF